MLGRPVSLGARYLGNTAVELEKLFHLCDVQRGANSITDPYQRQFASASLAAHISAHHDANPGRIDVGHAAHFQDQDSRRVCAHRVLKFKKIAESDGASQAQDSLSGAGNRFFANLQGFRWHIQRMLTSANATIVNAA